MSYVRIEVDDGIARIALARPEARNALNAEMIAELSESFRHLRSRAGLRVLVLTADGETFCAGADANWMRSQKDVTMQENISDAEKIFDLFRSVYEFPLPIITRVQGGAFGGGAGLLCCSDIVVMAENALTAFSEVRLGVVPATISLFVLRRIGEGRARELFLTGRRISARECEKIGLATEVVPDSDLDKAVEKWIHELLAAAPSAQATVKELLRDVPRMSLDMARDYAPKKIASQRVSPDGQEGLTALLEKRQPNWSIRK